MRTGHVVSVVCYVSGVVCSNIVIGMIILDMLGQCCVFRIWMLGSNIVIELYVLDMWSVLCVPYVGVGV